MNVGCWESADAFRAATQCEGFRNAAGRLDAFTMHASAYEVVRT